MQGLIDQYGHDSSASSFGDTVGDIADNDHLPGVWTTAFPADAEGIVDGTLDELQGADDLWHDAEGPAARDRYMVPDVPLPRDAACEAIRRKTQR